MSFLSAMGSDCTLHNLNITGTLTLANEPTTIIPENLDISNLNVSSDTSLNMLYVMGSTQLGGEIATNNAHFYTAFNANGVLPQPNTNTDAPNCYGVICSNLSDADAEFNFVNTYEANASDVNAIAFSWYKTGFGSTPICGLTNNGLMKVNGLNTDNAEANTITALTSSSLGVATATVLLVVFHNCLWKMLFKTVSLLLLDLLFRVVWEYLMRIMYLCMLFIPVLRILLDRVLRLVLHKIFSLS